MPDATTTLLAARFAAPLPAQANHAMLCLLDHEGVIAIEGPDTARFLQGQVTCDVNALQIGQSTLGARCNPKGRMQSSFRLVRVEQDCYLLALHAGLVERQLAELKKYAVFFKTQLRDASSDWLRLGLAGERCGQLLDAAGLPRASSRGGVERVAAGLVLTLADDAAELWLKPEHAASLIDRLANEAPPASVQAWLLRQIREGVGQVFPETYEAFIPQMLNLQQLGGVSFRKGCYTGQEIVARMQYLGKLKRRMFRLLLTGEAVPEPGTAIVDTASGQTVGETVIAARSESGIEALAVLHKDAAQLPTLAVDSSNGPLLSLAGLPYDAQLEAGEADKQ